MKQYFYNKFIEMYCVIDTTYANEDITELVKYLGDMEEVEMPDYITEDYDCPTW